MRAKKSGDASQVAVLIDQQVNKSGLRAATIAEKAGFNGHQMLSMIRRGTSRVPFERINGLAKSLQIKESKLFHDCLEEYQPTVLALIERNYVPRLNKASQQLHDALASCGKAAKSDMFRLSDDQVARIKAIIKETKPE